MGVGALVQFLHVGRKFSEQQIGAVKLREQISRGLHTLKGSAATVGFILGGFFSGRLVRRGSLPPAARLWIMLMSAALVPLVGFVPAIPSVMGVIGIAMVVAYAATAWLSNITSLVVDLVPQRILGTAFGVIACGSALGGFFMNKGVAWLIDHRSYDDSFYIMAVAHPVALLLVWRLRKRANAV